MKSNSILPVRYLSFAIVLGALLITLFAPSARSDSGGLGPIESTNQLPFFLLFLQPPPDKPSVLKPGEERISLFLDLANTMIVFVNDPGNKYSVEQDLESERLNISYRRGIADKTELQVHLPLLYFSGGFADAFIDDWHTFFGLPRGNRPDFADFRFSYLLRRNGTTVLEGKQGSVEAGNLSLFLKYLLKEETKGSPALTGRVGIKIPTGDSTGGFGSGSPDFSVGLLSQLSSKHWYLYQNLDFVKVGKADRFLSSEIKDILSSVTTLEYAQKANQSWIVQMSYASNPVKTAPDVSKNGLMLVLGGKYLTRGGILYTFGFTEDIRVETSPDFAVFFGASFKNPFSKRKQTQK